MVLELMLGVALSASPDDFSPPPLVTADTPLPQPPMVKARTTKPRLTADARIPPPPPMPPPEPLEEQPPVATPVRVARLTAEPPPPRVKIVRVREEQPADDVPLYEVKALGVAGLNSTSEWAGLTTGLRGEVDLFRLGIMLTYDRTVEPWLAMSRAQDVGVHLGFAPLASHWGRLRLMTGVDLRSEPTNLRVGPLFTVTGRAGLGFIAADGAVTLTPVPFRRFEARAAVVLRALFFELHGGYRIRMFDDRDGGNLGTMFTSVPDAGPYLALGVSL